LKLRFFFNAKFTEAHIGSFEDVAQALNSHMALVSKPKLPPHGQIRVRLCREIESDISRVKRSTSTDSWCAVLIIKISYKWLSSRRSRQTSGFLVSDAIPTRPRDRVSLAREVRPCQTSEGPPGTRRVAVM